MGLVTQVFDEQKLRGLHGEVAIGHTRYSTTGSTHWANAQPLIQHGRGRTVALGHNGNLVNAEELRGRARRGRRDAGDDLRHRGDRGADRERPRAARGRGGARDGPARRRVLGRRCSRRGSWSASATAHGFRPLVLGRGEDGEWILASETCSLDLVGAELERELAPGELVIDRRGRRARAAGGGARGARARSASSSSSTWPGPTRGSTASRCTARACGWASGSPPRRRSRPTS